ncbi:MAG: protein phosphatase 2C domain-containing protein [Pyrinomonadaceae bacterium]
MTQNIQSAAVSDRGLSEKRPQNEDSFLELPEYGLFVVCDGVGGAQAGDVASQMATEMLGEAFANARDGGDVEDLMRVAIEKANEAIYQMSHDLPQLATMATTIVALHIVGNIATIGHVGDSRLYRIDSRGNLFRETQDHSVVEEEVRAGRMTSAQAAHHPSKNVISRALGADKTVEVDLKTIMFEPNTSFLLCSDGVTRHIEDHEIRELLRSGKEPAEICAEMKNICYERGAEDNLTAIVVRAAGAVADTETEENTIATARPATVGSAAFAQAAANELLEIPTQNFQMPATENSQTQDIADDNLIAIPATANAGNSNSENVLPVAETNNYQPAKADKIFPPTKEKMGDSGIGKLLFGSILGLIIGAAAVYFLYRPQPPTQVVRETPKITEMQTPNIAYSAFEDNRRNVDQDPSKYIAANGASANDAEDYYLLGRAYLLTEKYVDAKNALTKAKNLLPQTGGADKTMLADEIAISLSIVDSNFSKAVLQAEKKNMLSATGQNANTNAAANTNSSTEIKPINSQTNANR